MEKPKKILVLMSGGVDSSVCAALLKQAGHEVAGVYLKLWEPSDTESLPAAQHKDSVSLGDPCWAREMQDAARVAAHLGIPFTVWDVTQEYKERVLKNFYSEYAAGRTPNPDVLCNSEIKFGIGLTKALAAGYDYVATGHYAQLSSQSSVHSSQYELYAAVDKNKDQSYFLWQLTQEQLKHIMFPIGEYTKPQVREMAKKFGLHNAGKKDSQGVCFLGKIKLKEFLYGGSGQVTAAGATRDLATRSRQSGPIVDVHGNLLGYHDGLAHFTIGQRQGTKLGGNGPYFVVEKDLVHNTLVVANEKDEPDYRAVECTIRNVNWIGEYPESGRKLMARVRYRALLTSVNVHFHTIVYESACRVIFDEPARAVALGQSIVFYDGDNLIGGGIIRVADFPAACRGIPGGRSGNPRFPEGYWRHGPHPHSSQCL